MQLSSTLLHAENGRRVVLVSAHEGDRLLGSALGEAGDAEVAEDRALARLQARLTGVTAPRAAEPGPKPRPWPAPPLHDEPAPPSSVAPPVGPPVATPVAAPPPVAAPAAPPPLTSPPSPSVPGVAASAPVQEPPPDPEDWSSELAQLDLQLRRLGWAREQEAVFLQRSFGHPSRSRLTTYADLTAYLSSLEELAAQADPATAPVPLRRQDLLRHSDQLLLQLGWEAEQGRGFLERHLAVTSRQLLSDKELLQFNMLLEGELIESSLQK